MTEPVAADPLITDDSRAEPDPPKPDPPEPASPKPEPPDPPEPVEATTTSRRVDTALRAAGWIVCAGLGLALGVYEAFLAPVIVSGVRLPIAPLLAVLGNPPLAWLAYVTTGRRAAGLVPATTWCLVWVAASSRTAEGDLVVTTGNWVGMATLLLGPVAFAVGIGAIILRRPLSGRPLSGRPWSPSPVPGSGPDPRP